MKVLFLKDCLPYRKGEVHTVAEGFARNYLIPKNFAQPATTSGILESEKRAEKQKLENYQVLEAIKNGLESIQGKTMEIKAKSSEHGKLYAAVTSEKIALELQKEYNFMLPKELVSQLPQIKTHGEHQVKLQYEGKEYYFTLKI